MGGETRKERMELWTGMETRYYEIARLEWKKRKGLAGGKDKNCQGKKVENGCEISALLRDADDKTISIDGLKGFPL